MPFGSKRPSIKPYLAFLKFYKQAKGKKIKEKPPPFFRSFILAYTL